MAGSRLEKLGTVFTRTRDLMRARVINEKAKPIWYDVYAAFPPKREPIAEKPLRRQRNLPDNVPAILYSEDFIRAKFYETYGSAGIFHLYRKDYRSVCQSFVDTFIELQKAGEVSNDKLFEEASKALLAKGISLRRSAGMRVPNWQMSENQSVSHVKSTPEDAKPSDETEGQPGAL
ncbi:small ribosomal subunit protein mS23 [Pseudophryne corroboree]|uniref:small ribosomal subunit protein mS23 n=1 Tax=Pseudophryne corroboree TaxID=495146 RepID=UPI0030818AD5